MNGYAQGQLTLTWNNGQAVLSNISQPQYIQKAIYGTDDRMDDYQIVNTQLKAIGDSTAALMDVYDLSDNGDGTFSVPNETLADFYLNEYGRPLCADEPYRDQLSPALCTGFLVAPDIIATTSHCVVDNDQLAGLAFVFGFKMLNSTTPVTTFDASEIYYGTQIVAQVQTADADWALIRLDREVTVHAALPMRRSGVVDDNQAVSVVGHTLGLPLKYTANASVQDNLNAQNFQANLDAYMGNSGSPVVNMSTYEIEGLLFAGNPDFVGDGDCDRSSQCPDSGCPNWEKATRTTEFSDLIPVFDVYLGTSPDNMQLIASDLPNPWCPAGQLDCGRNYYWQVVVRSNCMQVASDIWVFSAAPAGDVDNDCDVDIVDFAELSSAWLTAPCGQIDNYCDQLDIDKQGSVGLDDLAIFVGNWLEKINS